ncbi:head GIN domain-containing protein [Rufibacter tibetensis]|uniref:head GIN domain-containing protein n=1 Tax=Rufibacter tibetensis TaxID=512763 RepID=UPI001470645C|nr:head GIN domain-containing protein [Rufibacter tibetensis]
MFLKPLLKYLLICFSLSLVTSCDILGSGFCIEGQGETKKEFRDVSAFKGVDLRLPGNVIITGGPKTEISIETFANLLPEITTELEGSTLVIRSESCLEFTNDEATIHISLPNIENVELKSSGQIRVQSVKSPKNLKLNLSGSGKIHYLGSTVKINALNSGSGDIVLEGFANTLETKVSGSGRMEGYSLNADSVRAVSTGSGHQYLWVSRVLDASVEGSGNIYFRGHPFLRTTITKGSGKVIDDN